MEEHVLDYPEKTGRLRHAPKEHPPIPPAKIGVVLVNLGTPDATDYWSMRRYLKEFLSDRRVIEVPRLIWWPLLNGIILTTRPRSSGKNYAMIWNKEKNESPLLTTTRSQTEKVKERFSHNKDIIVDFAMRYGNPSTESVLKKLQQKGCEKILFFPLYPQYAAPTTATANDAAFRALMKLRWQPALRTVPAYFENKIYIEALARSITNKLSQLETAPDQIVASYHGLPKSYLLKGDPYHCQCHKTTRLLLEYLGWEKGKIITTFQSRFGNEEWLQPYTVEKVAELAQTGKKNILVFAPGFSADCVETLEEINGEICESFEEAGGETFTYVDCLNDDDIHIDMMESIIRRELMGWLA
jgi:ferrochelatase